MRCALVDLSTGAVVNVVMADPAVDEAPEGFAIYAVPEGADVDETTVWTVDGPVTPPKPEPPPKVYL